MLRLLGSVVILRITLLLAQAQTPDSPVFRVNVNLVQVDAVVTDSKGASVAGLTAADFDILQDGKLQKITNFSYVSPAAKAPNSGLARKGDVPTLTPKLTPPDVRRTLALVVDDLSLSFESMYRVRQALQKFVDEEMQPGDLVAIMRTGAGMGVLQQFTADKRILQSAIEHLKYNAIRRPQLQLTDTGDAGGLSEYFTVGTLGAVLFAVDGLRDLPGRKSLALFSENLRVVYQPQGTQFTTANAGIVDQLQRLGDRANRAGVAIYGVDPRGLAYSGITAADNVAAMSARRLAQVLPRRLEDVSESQDGLRLLADQTGGLFLGNTNDLSGALQKALADSSYYLIGYHPDAMTFDAKHGPLRFHRLEVRVKRPGLLVRWRKGFLGNPDSDRPAPSGRQLMMRALHSPFTASGIHVRLTPLFANDSKSGSFLTTMLYLDARDFRFVDEPDGWHRAEFDFIAATYGDDSAARDVTNKKYTMRAKGSTYELALKNGLIYSVAHSVRKPGAYQLRVAVRDVNSGRLGSASQFVEVPDLKNGKLTLSSILLNEKAPAGGNADPMGSAAIRIFKPGQTMALSWEIFNAHAGGKGSPDISIETHLFHDGEQVFESKPLAADLKTNRDPKRVQMEETLELGADSRNGDYVLQVAVTDNLAKGKYRTASQTMDFEVAGR